MAVSVDIASTMTTLWDGDTVGTWTGGTPDTFSGFQREGSACLGIAVSTALVETYRAVTSFNFNNNRIYIWVSPRGTMDTTANGGVRIIVGDGTNRMSYYVGGSDYSTPFTTGGGWYCYVLDRNNLPSGKATLAGSEGSMNWSAITQVGVGFKTLSKSLGGAANCFWDIARQGTGLIIEGGTSGDKGKWSEIAADDASTASGKAYGIVMEFQPGVYGVQGQISFGDNGTSNSHFEDIDSVVVFMDTGVSDDFYKLDLIGNTTGTNVFIQGVKTGTGDGISGANGVTVMSGGPTVDIDLTNANMDTVHWYGGKMFRITGTIKLPTNTASEVAGLVVDQSSQVEGNQCIIRNCTFGQTVAVSGSHTAALLWNDSINIKYCAFNNNTDPDVTYDAHGIEHPTAGTYSYIALTFSNNEKDLLFSAASGNLVINASDGANPNSYTITGSGSVTINNSITFELTNVVSGSKLYVYALAGGSMTPGDEIIAPTDITTDPWSTTLNVTSQPFGAHLRKGTTPPYYKSYEWEDTIGTGKYARRIAQILD